MNTSGTRQEAWMISERLVAALSSSRALFALLIGCTAVRLPAPAAWGQTATSGSVSGRVKNAATRLYLSNAKIAIRDTDYIAYTDSSGTYHLVGVPGGSAVLEVSY